MHGLSKIASRRGAAPNKMILSRNSMGNWFSGFHDVTDVDPHIAAVIHNTPVRPHIGRMDAKQEYVYYAGTDPYDSDSDAGSDAAADEPMVYWQLLLELFRKDVLKTGRYSYSLVRLNNRCCKAHIVVTLPSDVSTPEVPKLDETLEYLWTTNDGWHYSTLSRFKDADYGDECLYTSFRTYPYSSKARAVNALCMGGSNYYEV